MSTFFDAKMAGRRTDWASVIGSVAVLAVVAVALALRATLRTNVDVAWLLTVGEKVLDGQRLYADILEVNPPASMIIYWPAILIARTLGLHAGAGPRRARRARRRREPVAGAARSRRRPASCAASPAGRCSRWRPPSS